jgi:gas vesicle protein
MTDSAGTFPGDSSSNRLDRIEALLAQTAENLSRTEKIVQQNAAGLRETRAIADGNARAIASWSARIEDGIAETEEIATQTRQDLSERIDSQSERIDSTERQVEDDWTRSDQRLKNIPKDSIPCLKRPGPIASSGEAGSMNSKNSGTNDLMNNSRCGIAGLMSTNKNQTDGSLKF